jgi:hypothetical protein
MGYKVWRFTVSGVGWSTRRAPHDVFDVHVHDAVVDVDGVGGGSHAVRTKKAQTALVRTQGFG